ncbi:hypothetical protein Sipo8835_13360 [Streptomyces ipomoeae]|jgi:hypothetical protein|uniref:HD domain-containing protein n=2 Tax=Streptomyces ipomoeae TaxID=103232 RepID=L1KQZ7_9ACTN|nr:hypothetical protein [Streptomyces ipomoeae]EKX62905.1 hypothetical protein STRIP9103_08699 [Streptomyces ipomoeae 91-03]MDX2695539.1 hypothetical protein [Streptomyces ipomoeae]MDX2822266.1 hypothetical protein [Streptomyces ipomoeae]MDX2840608.1 hypothetical protein [Streptomyces ipomoeae]MDX2874767.1 hypothetical protein [Streptomyces ipomoeae]
MELRSVEELMDLLHARRGGREAPDRHRGAPDGRSSRAVDRMDPQEHALQTAALLRRGRPADKELQVAGLVHTVGQLLRPGDDTSHADLAADAIRPLLGERVARLVRLHTLGPDDLVRLHAGGLVDAVLVEDVLTLRQAEEAGRTPGVDAGVLEDWRTVLELVADRAGRASRVSASSHLTPGT